MKLHEWLTNWGRVATTAPTPIETFEQWDARITAEIEAQHAEFERQDRARHPEDYPRPTSFCFFGASGPRT